jgi:hypothetical protein
MGADSASFLEGFAGAIFLLAAVAKSLSRVSLSPFLVGLGVDRRAARAAAPLVAPVEAVLGTLLVLGVADLPVAAASLGLGLAFAAVQARALARRLDDECRCFGAFDVEAPPLVAARAALVVLVLGAVLGLAATGAASGSLVAGASGSAVALGVTCGIAIVLALALAGQLVRFRQRRPRVKRLRATVVRG